VKTDTLPMLSLQDWALLRDHIRPASFPRGSVILPEGGHRRALHLVSSGTVRVEQGQNGRGIALAVLGPGEIFGEMGFVENAPASASVVAEDDAMIDIIEGEALQSVMASEPGFAVRFYHSIAITLIRRLRTTSLRLAQAGTAEVAQINRLHVPRTGNISARQVPAELSAGLEAFERAMLSVKQEFRAASLSEADAAARVGAQCENVVRLLRQFTAADPLIEMSWSDLLAFRDAPQLEAGVGDYVFRETFHTLMLSATVARCYAKPRGFPDDHETMAVIYANQPDGDDRLGPLIDRWFLDRPICRARRAARDRLQDMLLQRMKARSGGEVKVASLASGSASELLTLLDTPDGAALRASCIDLDGEALLATARRAERGGSSARLTLIRANVVPASGDALPLSPQQVIYALGLCEYLSNEQIVSLLDRSYDALAPGGEIILTNLGASNPDRELMEHVLGWTANHRSVEELQSLFTSSKFAPQPADISGDEIGVMLFARCTKNAADRP
jgi:extracellular factor (EF) 3-hydroxypalmitic acid methyl ester biosynthesis protein